MAQPYTRRQTGTQMRVFFESKCPWKENKEAGFSIYSAGFFQGDVKVLLGYLTEKNLAAVEQFLKAEKMSFGFIISAPGFVFAALDRIRSFPVFYHVSDNAVSNHAQNIAASLDKSYRAGAVLEFCMAGYTQGADTLHDEIKQLQQGEFLYFTEEERVIRSYYNYKPAPVPQKKSEAEYTAALNDIMDCSVKRMISAAAGAPIYVPLSGGMDSRLILCKLHEHGYPALYSFSYGMNHNFEACTAQRVARQLGVSWQMVPARPNMAQGLFNSQIRKDYEAFAHGYAAIPSYVEFEAIYRLKEQNIAPAESFIINGQTGDFISGGHIPAVLYENEKPGWGDLLGYIADKHFSLWPHLKTPENVKLIRQAAEKNIRLTYPECSTQNDLISAYEHFEWKERQGKVVVQNQRIYEFFGYNWLLPLWDSELVDFFETLPFELKYKQKLFNNYLKQYNYKGAFDIPRARPQNWLSTQSFNIMTANILALLKGPEAKQNFYKRMQYYGSARYQYELFGKDLFDKHALQIRNMISLSVYDFCQSHHLPFPAP